MALRVSLLGFPRIELDAAGIQVDTRKAIAVLAYLATTDGPVRRDALTFLFWPDYAEDRARAALRRTLSALRSGLKGGWVIADRTHVELPRTGDLWVDVTEFDELHTSQALDDLRRAAVLYRGEFLAGFSVRGSPEFEHWQLGQAARYQALASSILERLAEAEAAHGDLGAAIVAARRRLELDPLHEPAHRHLMTILARAGDRAAALRQYRGLAGLLEEELGVGPLPETTAVYHQIAEGRFEAGVEPPAGLSPITSFPAPRRLAFVGRDADLALLSAAYSDDTCRAVAITGEPGIGKTRLADEFVARLGTESLVVRAAAHRGEEAVPFGLTIEMLRLGLLRPGAEAKLHAVSVISAAETGRLVPELRNLLELPEPPPAESPGGHARLLRGAAEVIAALTAGGVVVLDDLQWADPESTAVLDRIVGDDHSPFVLALYRAGDLPAESGLAALVRAHTRERRFEVLLLGRLTPEDVAELLAQEAPEHQSRTEELVRLSEGVPYFAVEYLAAIRSGGVAETLPGGVRDLLTDRVAGLSGLAHQVLGAAAALGRSFGLDELRVVSGRSDRETKDALEELLQHGVVVESGQDDVFDFQHERLRQLVYESMSALRRRRLHGRAADRLLAKSRRKNGALAASAAVHLEAAGRLDEAAVQHVAAGDYARSLFANETALRHYDAALSLAHPEAGTVREAIGDLMALAGRYGEALHNLEAAAAISGEQPLARLEHKMAVIHARAGEWDYAEAHLLSASEGLEDEVARVLLWADWAWVAHRRGNTASASDLAFRALAEAASISHPSAMAQAHNVAGIIARASDPEEATRHFIQALELAGEQDLTLRAATLNNLALASVSGRHPEAGLPLAQESLEIYSTIGDRHREAAVHSNLADLLHALGRDDEAQDHLRAAASLFSEIGLEPGGLEPEIWKLTEW